MAAILQDASSTTTRLFQQALSHQRYGIVLGNVGRLGDAENAYVKSITIQKRLTQKFPRVESHHLLLSALFNNLGVVYDRRHELKTAEQYFRQAFEEGRQARQINALNFATRHNLSVQAQNITEILIRTGRYREAISWADEIVHAWPNNIFNVGDRSLRKLKECLVAAQNDASLTTSQRDELIHQIEDQAIEHVKLIVANTTENRESIASELQRNSEFEFVRRRAEFQAYCREVAEKFASKK